MTFEGVLFNCNTRTIDHTPARNGTCLNMEEMDLGQTNIMSVIRNDLCEQPHMQQRLPRCLHAYRDHRNQVLHVPDCNVAQMQVLR